MESNFDLLPNEILQTIMMKYVNKETYKSCLLVSKRFREAAKSVEKQRQNTHCPFCGEKLGEDRVVNDLDNHIGNWYHAECKRRIIRTNIPFENIFFIFECLGCGKETGMYQWHTKKYKGMLCYNCPEYLAIQQSLIEQENLLKK